MGISSPVLSSISNPHNTPLIPLDGLGETPSSESKPLDPPLPPPEEGFRSQKPKVTPSHMRQQSTISDLETRDMVFLKEELREVGTL
jgi:hypothetical protein